MSEYIYSKMIVDIKRSKRTLENGWTRSENKLSYLWTPCTCVLLADAQSSLCKGVARVCPFVCFDVEPSDGGELKAHLWRALARPIIALYTFRRGLKKQFRSPKTGAGRSKSRVRNQWKRKRAHEKIITLIIIFYVFWLRGWSRKS